jgi:hypothetical protein
VERLCCPRGPARLEVVFAVQSVDLRIAQLLALQPIRCSCAVPCGAVRCCAQQPRRAQRTTAAASLARLLPHTAQHKHSAIPFQRRWRAGLPLGGPQWPLYCPVVAAAHTTLWVLFPIDQPAAPRESDASRHGGSFRRVWHNFFGTARLGSQSGPESLRCGCAIGPRAAGCLRGFGAGTPITAASVGVDEN